jgi:hypothetical protein
MVQHVLLETTASGLAYRRTHMDSHTDTLYRTSSYFLDAQFYPLHPLVTPIAWSSQARLTFRPLRNRFRLILLDPSPFMDPSTSASDILATSPTPNPASLMCSYTRDPHLAPQAPPLPSKVVLPRKKQLNSNTLQS